MTNLYQEYEPNTIGRDFVVSDIHGCYTDLYGQLMTLSFNADKDRLFSVGDLADRGPESKTALEFIKNPWFHPVLGNHEEMFLQCWIEREEPVGWHIQNGGLWASELTFAERNDYQNDLSKLPLIIRIGKVLICHSLLPRKPLKSIINDIQNLHDFIIWKRDENYIGGPEGFITYAGHTIHPEVTRYGNIIDIDTGAFLKYWSGCSGKLTIVDITSEEIQ